MHPDFLFASLKVAAPNRALMRAEIENTDPSLWIWDSYRASTMLPIMTLDGNASHSGVNRLAATQGTKAEAFNWTSFAPPSVKEYLEKNIFPWMGMRARVMVAKTPPNEKLNEHIDCEQNLIETRQHKFRLVISGGSETLYFLTQTGKVSAPATNLPFLIDGAWPHGMLNSTQETKLTLCIGAPWTGCETYPEFEQVLLKSNFSRPTDLRRYFKASV